MCVYTCVVCVHMQMCCVFMCGYMCECRDVLCICVCTCDMLACMWCVCMCISVAGWEDISSSLLLERMAWWKSLQTHRVAQLSLFLYDESLEAEFGVSGSEEVFSVALEASMERLFWKDGADLCSQRGHVKWPHPCCLSTWESCWMAMPLKGFPRWQV